MNTIFASDSEIKAGWVNAYPKLFGLVHDTRHDAVKYHARGPIHYRIRIRPWIKWDGKDPRGPDLPKDTRVFVKMRSGLVCGKSMITDIAFWGWGKGRYNHWHHKFMPFDIVAYQVSS